MQRVVPGRGKPSVQITSKSFVESCGESSHVSALETLKKRQEAELKAKVMKMLRFCFGETRMDRIKK